METEIVEEVFKESEVFGEAEKTVFAEFVCGEIAAEEASDSRTGFLQKLRKWRRQRIARPEQEIKTEPFPKSTNLAPPLTMSKVNTVFGKSLAGYTLKRPFWACDTNNPQMKLEADAFGRLLNAYAADPFSLNLKPVIRKALYETISLGNQFYEAGWVHDTVMIENADGTKRETVLRSGPEIRLFNTEDIVVNQSWTDLQKAPWLALRFQLTWSEVLNFRDIGRYNADAVEKLRAFRKTTMTEAELEQAEHMGLRPQPSSTNDLTATFDLHKFYAKWLVGDSVVDLVGIAHVESKTLLYVEPNKLGWRLVGKIGYFSMPDSIFDIGVCHQCEFLQEEVEMLHNFGGDAMKWSMLGTYKAKKDAGISHKEAIYPGKIFMVESMDDFQEMRFDVDLSPAIAKENIVMRYADMATGANQAMSGQADQTLKSGGGAMAQQVLAQSSATILDAEFDTMDEHFSEMAKFVAILVMKNSAFVPLETLVSPEDAQVLQGFFSQYSEADLVSSFRFTVKTTDIQRSESAKKESLALFSQLYSGYVTEILNLMAQQMQMQQVPQMAMFIARAISGKTDLMRQIADYLHVGIDPEKYFVVEGANDAGSTENAGLGIGGQMGAGLEPGIQAGAGLPTGSVDGNAGFSQGAAAEGTQVV